MTIHLGAIADDFTGATDLGNMFVQGGLRTLLLLGVPPPGFDAGTLGDCDALVVALKSRSIPPHDAVTQSLEALAWLQARGARRFYFKYCSTFDSTPRGNIGPVTDALLDALSEDFTVVVPAYPKYRRTVFNGLLFVADVPLDESPLRNHPLNPMTDASLPRLMDAQSKGRTGAAPYRTVHAGADALRTDLDRLRTEGFRYAVVDTVFDEDLDTIAAACAGLRLITGGSGLGLGAARHAFQAQISSTAQRANGLKPSTGATSRPIASGAAKTALHPVALAGSCSQATLEQIDAARAAQLPCLAVDARDVDEGEDVAAAAIAWALPLLAKSPVLIYSSADPAARAVVQERCAADISTRIEQAFADIAAGLVAAGVTTLVVAGGETSGAVVQALRLDALEIGAEIDPAVPWVYTHAGASRGALTLALKSGNFGAPDFFLKALGATRGAGR